MPQSSTSETSSGLLIGIIVGVVGCLLLVVVIVAVVWMKRRQQRNSNSQLLNYIELTVPASPNSKNSVAAWTPLRDVEIGIKLGSGNFGEVFKGNMITFISEVALVNPI
jgi:flagellar basal body-associated protein FliL